MDCHQGNSGLKVARPNTPLGAVCRSTAIDQRVGNGAQVDVFQLTASRHAPRQARHVQTLLPDHL